MSDSWFEETFAAPVADAAEETAIEAAPPSESDTPIDTPTESPIDETPIAAEPEVEATSDVVVNDSVADVETPVEVQAEPASINWNDPANPHLPKAQALDQLQAVVHQERTRRNQQEFVQKMHDLSDNDAERFQELTGLLGTVAQPLQAAVHQAVAERDEAGKIASGLFLALQNTLSPEQVELVRAEYAEVMSVDGAKAMESFASHRSATNQRANARISELEAKNKELALQLASRAQLADRVATGADLVDGGGGGAALDRKTAMQEAPRDNNAFFDAFFR